LRAGRTPSTAPTQAHHRLRSIVGKPTYLKTKNFQLKLNGQSRHLDGQGITRNYMMNRLMPMIHSAAREDYTQV
jgi:hypothetical protein